MELLLEWMSNPFNLKSLEIISLKVDIDLDCECKVDIDLDCEC